AIDDAVEGALALRGALPPCAPVGALPEVAVRDQVLRARALGASGIALQFPRLSSTLAEGTLGVEESALISASIAPARRGRVVALRGGARPGRAAPRPRARGGAPPPGGGGHRRGGRVAPPPRGGGGGGGGAPAGHRQGGRPRARRAREHRAARRARRRGGSAD